MPHTRYATEIAQPLSENVFPLKRGLFFFFSLGGNWGEWAGWNFLRLNPSIDWQHLHILPPKYIVWTAYYTIQAVSENLYSFLDFQMRRSPLNLEDSWKDLQGKYNETDFLTRVGHTAHINLRVALRRFIWGGAGEFS